MNQSNYLNSLNAYIKAFENLTFNDNEVLLGQFNIVSASLSNFLPSINFSNHNDIYRKILLHKKLSILDQSSYQVLNFVETENFGTEMMNILKTKPTIICTFHTGSYRVINLLLAKHKIPFTLVMGKEISQKEGNLFSTLFNNLSNNSKADNFSIIDAENATAGMQMLRKLKQGRTLVLYIDGNTGVGESTTANANSCVINFLYQKLFARQGISFIAHVANVPILPVMSYRASWEEIRLKFFEPIYPNKNSDRETFARETTQLIYDLASPIIESCPEQWEGWLYVHKFAKILPVQNQFQNSPIQSPGAEKIGFNSEQFGIFKIHNTPFLLKKNTYSFYEINNELYDLLTTCIEQSIHRGNFENNIFSQLYEQGVLRPL